MKLIIYLDVNLNFFKLFLNLKKKYLFIYDFWSIFRLLWKDCLLFWAHN